MSYLAVLSLLPLLLSGMACGRQGMPAYSGKFWAGSSEVEGIERRQDTPPGLLRCGDPRFDGYICLSAKDLACLYSTFVLNCSKWKSLNPGCPNVSTEQVKDALEAMGLLR